MQASEPSARELELRASDLDRSAVVDILQAACADGRISLPEHSERTDSALRAKTVGELSRLIADLGHVPRSIVMSSAGQPPPPVELPSYSSSRAVMSEVRRTGAWLVPEQMSVTGMMGEIRLDMREAYFASHRILIDVSLLMAELQIRVHQGTRVEDRTRLIAADLNTKSLGTPRPDAPLIVLTGSCVMSSITVRGYDGAA
ncbi:protein of unknown function [Propionibacterium cyclohexanicum]|uniref:DUF1707 domain-containing protein n=1 Tax=Propionibacterium cyclohexanicum TaxID=64702 RepID=A0A1H9SL84_9ACTN|nr:DUF1707 domain-containing protein [Propionibacterium cyclohexanicum]SER85113.1 protein of unknown function [Propionibacterium cyclohexanicum]